ncbi:MAG: hypothetical protein O3A48_04305 [Actinomycetota bacterium]|nr:hypothetical protein [Actinomycetota bacterium]MDA3013741.1 hypothetical protein [Actinomycetota bacterium]
MNRLKRFEKNRYVGLRSNMRVYDCDDNDQFERLLEKLDNVDYISKNLIQAFGPDTLEEALNRGYSLT